MPPRLLIQGLWEIVDTSRHSVMFSSCVHFSFVSQQHTRMAPHHYSLEQGHGLWITGGPVILKPWPYSEPANGLCWEASMLGALHPGKQITWVGVCNLSSCITQLHMTRDFAPKKDLRRGLSAFVSGANPFASGANRAPQSTTVLTWDHLACLLSTFPSWEIHLSSRTIFFAGEAQEQNVMLTCCRGNTSNVTIQFQYKSHSSYRV